jgi:hypothetical protein
MINVVINRLQRAPMTSVDVQSSYDWYRKKRFNEPLYQYGTKYYCRLFSYIFLIKYYDINLIRLNK